MRVCDLTLSDAAAIIGHFQMEASSLQRELDINVAGIGMASDIGEELLKDPEDGSRTCLIEIGKLIAEIELTFDAGARLKLLGLPFDRGNQAEFVEHARTQFRRDAAYRLDRLIDQLRHRFELVEQRLLAILLARFRHAFIEPEQVDLERGER